MIVPIWLSSRSSIFFFNLRLLLVVGPNLVVQMITIGSKWCSFARWLDRLAVGVFPRCPRVWM
jgi:hypothetical protein